MSLNLTPALPGSLGSAPSRGGYVSILTEARGESPGHRPRVKKNTAVLKTKAPIAYLYPGRLLPSEPCVL